MTRFLPSDGTRRRLANLVFVVAVIAIWYAGVRCMSALWRDLNATDAAAWAPVALAMACYVGAHAARILRLAMLAGSPSISLRQIGLVHLQTSAASILIPFKLGEIYRVAELGHLMGRMSHAVITVWVERAFDSAALVIVIVLALAVDPTILAAIQPLVAMAALFVGATVVLFAIFPDTLATLSLFVLRRYEGSQAVRTLRTLQWVRNGIALGPRFIARKMAPLVVLTVTIWILELAAFAALLGGGRARLAATVTGLPVHLSSQSSGGLSVAPGTPHATYALATATILLLLGAVAALAYAPARLRIAGPSSGSVLRPRPRLSTGT